VSCCGSEPKAGPDAPAAEVLLASRIVANAIRQTELSLPAVHCGGCIRAVETTLTEPAGVQIARVNLSSRRATVRWQDDGVRPPLVEALQRAGFEAHLFDTEPDRMDGALSELIRALAVASANESFAAGPVLGAAE
jgi:Cu2+-exporting ATPase